MGYLIVILLLCASFSYDGLAKKRHHKHYSKSGGTKIVGGEEADIKETPYQAFMLLGKGDDNYQCGGSIISTFFILTAAHCFKDKGIETVAARIGSTDKFFGGELYPGTFKIHSDYDQLSKDYDIAYVKTDKEMVLDGVNAKIISLVDEGSSVPPGTVIKLSGWGTTSEGGSDSQTLRKVEVLSLSNEQCRKKESITDHQFCGGVDGGGKDTCQGDSGGPAVLGDSGLLAGVVSAGYGCGRPDKPGIYTNISSVRAWVKENTGV